jgi:hypothetical protein
MVEQLPLKQLVEGSNPPGVTEMSPTEICRTFDFNLNHFILNLGALVN